MGPRWHRPFASAEGAGEDAGPLRRACGSVVAAAMGQGPFSGEDGPPAKTRRPAPLLRDDARGGDEGGGCEEAPAGAGAGTGGSCRPLR